MSKRFHTQTLMTLCLKPSPWSDILRNMAVSDRLAAVGRALEQLSSDAQECFGPQLVSITLYGSGAEDRLRPTSDVNLILVFGNLDLSAVERFAPKLQFAQAAARIAPMFIKESEIPAAAELFAQKFSDIHRRHRVLYGRDCFHDSKPDHRATAMRMRQVLLNMTLRLREAYAERSAQPDRLVEIIADFAGPLRTCAATLRELKGETMLAPKEALERYAAASGLSGEWLTHFSDAREQRALSNPAAMVTAKSMLAAAESMRAAVEAP